MHKTAGLIAALCISGCAIEPNTVRVEGEHLSHLTQHFGADPTHFGLDSVSVVAHWGKPAGAFLELGEGIELDRAMRVNGDREIGAFFGPRELFTGRIGYTFKLKE